MVGYPADSSPRGQFNTGWFTTEHKKQLAADAVLTSFVRHSQTTLIGLMN